MTFYSVAQTIILVSSYSCIIQYNQPSQIQSTNENFFVSPHCFDKAGKKISLLYLFRYQEFRKTFATVVLGVLDISTLTFPKFSNMRIRNSLMNNDQTS